MTCIINSSYFLILSTTAKESLSILEIILIALGYLTFFAVAGLFLVLLERRVAAWFQLRIGPNRVGYQGLLQTMADALKLVSKELTGTIKADKLLYNLAPYFVIITALMSLAVFPFSKQIQAFDINIGIFFLIAVSSIGVIGILLGGWASNNKFALIGAMRSGVQTISYELSVGLSLLTMILITGSLQLSEIVEVQRQGGWLILQGHIPAIIAFMVYMIAGTAETNRAPFDLVEAESELGAGFHTEYSGMKFAYFFLAEFINMFIIASIATTVFFGAWLSPFGITESIPWLGVFWFLAKAMVLVFLMMWFRWTFPRLRVDQLLTLEWKYLLPINLVNIVIMALIVWLNLTIKF
ncbi:NADH-quinone oxidoreductase subunit NuoH [Aestuariivivens sp. NBU2969]|uniref:NADH-quinone oxidoreductase subunit NuoH n=1 Tax=Aestuariivivens sp. NBU2969 TaxID=2873267 RepID=UPI001CBF85B0|nr:NADH-quinone oxidoreductase subunit NuoH [Aestuariivivens sp. NBU2969]